MPVNFFSLEIIYAVRIRSSVVGVLLSIQILINDANRWRSFVTVGWRRIRSYSGSIPVQCVQSTHREIFFNATICEEENFSFSSTIDLSFRTTNDFSRSQWHSEEKILPMRSTSAILHHHRRSSSAILLTPDRRRQRRTSSQQSQYPLFAENHSICFLAFTRGVFVSTL